MKDEEKMTFRPFYISLDWVLTGPNLHWKQQNIHFWWFWPHAQDWKVIGVHFFLLFSLIFISFTCHTTHFDFYLYFWKIFKDFETLSIDMKKHVNFLLMQIIFRELDL
jgi:hypothetical protein